jgi:hypothetical protein
MGGLAILAGLFAGIGIWVFKRMIDLANWLTFDLVVGQLAHLGRWYVVLIPILGGLSVGVLTHYLIATERHHGVTGIMEAVALAGSRLRYKRIPVKVVASAISIGSGAIVTIDSPRQLHCLIASLRCKREKIIPNGDTRVSAGDILVIIADEFVRQEILNLCKVSEGSYASPSN